MSNRVRERMAGAAVLFVLAGLLQACGVLWRETYIAYLAVLTRSHEVEIQIDRTFIERYKNRVTIQATFTVDKAMGSPNLSFVDGDLHFSGRAPEIALPTVGEIANAGSEKKAVDIVHQAEATHRPLRVTGVWRIWAEHSGGTAETQGEPLPAYTMDNPKHVFEIHPATRINDIELLDSFRPVDGFKPGGAQRTFGIYEKAACTLKVESKKIAIVSPSGLYNDVEFIMEVTEARPLVSDDGRFVIASARDMGGGLLVKRLRLVFMKGTAPEKAVRLLRRGDRLHVYGAPRLDLAEISRRARESARNPALLTGSLPYEIIVLGVYPDKK